MKKSSSKTKKILVADDDPSIVDAIQLILEDEGYLVETATKGEYVKNLQDDLPNLILLDIWMSGVSGNEVCRYLKLKKKTKHIPVIMISANRDIEKISKECGAQDFIPKPFDINELLEKIKKYI
jgi:DNA-binding response OmpR family regulator